MARRAQGGGESRDWYEGAGYLEAVVRLEERTRRRQKRVMGGIIAFLSAVALVVSFLGVQARSEAKRADAEAAEAQKSAEKARKSADEANKSAAEARNATRMAAARARGRSHDCVGTRLKSSPVQFREGGPSSRGGVLLADIADDSDHDQRGQAVMTNVLANDRFEGSPAVTGVTQGAQRHGRRTTATAPSPTRRMPTSTAPTATPTR